MEQREHKVPVRIMNTKSHIRTLYKNEEIGQLIPAELVEYGDIRRTKESSQSTDHQRAI